MENGAIKPSLNGGQEGLQQAYRDLGHDQTAADIWTYKIRHMSYVRYPRIDRANFLPQAKVMESRLACLLRDEAYNKALETQNKIKAAKKNMADRKRQLDESQAPIKFVLPCVSLKPSLVLSCKYNNLPSDL